MLPASFDKLGTIGSGDHRIKLEGFVGHLPQWCRPDSGLLLNKASVFEHFPVIKRREVGYTYRMGLEARADEQLVGSKAVILVSRECLSLTEALRQYNKTWQLLRYEDFQRALGAVIFLNEIRSKPNEERFAPPPQKKNA